jgi:DNA-binding transcriptional LysR family regulator
MTLEQLRIFVAVAERQHMTRAADALNLTQQAVSFAIVALENAYSTALFHRVGRHIELTEAGNLFLEEARHSSIFIVGLRDPTNAFDEPTALVRYNAALNRVFEIGSFVSLRHQVTRSSFGRCYTIT